ncbi:MAG: glycosyltransferase family 92 protein [Selenomonadaceae bacterium]|nr:glycosyltransferase family 92 protein [Selenomonadaceae bacterium]
MVDKNLFLHDLAVVAILKNESLYLKEWLDYHLAAGVDHFYLYDNESTDNQAEVVKPYISAGLVDYTFAPGKTMQIVAYNDALKRFKFQTRYMAFIDGDEFIFPKSARSIVEVVDEILSDIPNAASFAINWQCFGSNEQDKADYSKGVLERFTRRAPSDWTPDGLGNAHVKTVANPRMINYFAIPHCANYFIDRHAVNENGKIVPSAFNVPVTVEKIVVNHYHIKSREEFAVKMKRGRADYKINTYDDAEFNSHDRNEIFDDGILKYFETRKIYKPPDKSNVNEKLLNALMKNLSPVFLPNTPKEFYAGKLENFLTCRAVSSYLKTKLTDDAPAKFFEEASLKAILQNLSSPLNIADTLLLIRELPEILKLPYPAVKDLRGAMLQIILLLKDFFHANNMWKDFIELDYIHDLLKE